jgi:hypothetical protein
LRPDPEPVYNLEVEGDHCYRVGSLGLLVHNASANPVCDAPNNPWMEVEHDPPTAKKVKGKERNNADAQVDAYKAYANSQGGSQGVLVIATVDGRKITLGSGRKGMRHIIERHIALYYQGISPADTTLFPKGTTWQKVVDWVKEAVKALGSTIPTDGPTPSVVLGNGMAVTMNMDNNRVVSIYPTAADKVYGFNVKDDVEPCLPC